MNLDINKLKVNNIQKSQETSVENLNSSAQKSSGVFAKDIEQSNLLCEKLHITRDQLIAIKDKYPSFLNMDINQQLEIVNNEFTKKNVSTVENSTSNDVNTSASQNEKVVEDVKNNGSNNNLSNSQEPTDYNFKSYSKLSNAEKVNVYVSELAKNKYMYASSDNKKTLEDWNSLSEEEKNALIKKEYSSFVKDNSQGLYDKDDVSLYLDKEMTKLQTASSLGLNKDEFMKKDPRYINSSIHDYLSGCLDKNLSEHQIMYKDSQYVLSRAVIKACKENGDDTYADGIEYNLAENEILSAFSKDGALEGQIKIDVQMKYLQEKLDKGIALDQKEQAVYDRLNKLVNSPAGKAYLNAIKNKSEHSNEQVNYGHLDALKKSEFGQDFEAAVNDEDRAFVINAYIKRTTKNLSAEERAKYIKEIISEITCNKDNAELALNLHANILEDADTATQSELIKTKTDVTPELNALNANVLKSNNVLKLLAITQDEMVEEDPERADNLATTTIDSLDNHKLLTVSKIYAASKSENIQSKHADKAITLEIKSDEDIDIQRGLLENVNEASSLTVRKNTAKRLDEVHKKNQIPLTEKFIEDKEVAKAMNEDGTLTRFYNDNQTPGFELLKNRFERDDFSRQEAISQLNTLSDQIKDCNKDNQLAMHKSMMQSKYSEVQEHTAGNIKNYDASVQSQALDAVYTSGNEKAIEKAVTSLENAPNYIQEAELPRIIGEAAVRNGQDSLNILTNEADSSASLKSKIANGSSLTPSEYNNLSSTEKREYFTNYFKKLPLEQKIKLLSSIPNGAQKKTIYVMIARTDSNLFNAIVKDKDRADALLSMGLPNDVNNKIANVVKFLAVSDIGYQNIAKKHDIDYKEQTKTNNVSYNTNPYGFDSKELYRKDKNGNLVV